ncbi:MAG: hypothetical protein AB7T14_04035 [Candidatus Methylacidiphilaceae bacterium]
MEQRIVRGSGTGQDGSKALAAATIHPPALIFRDELWKLLADGNRDRLIFKLSGLVGHIVEKAESISPAVAQAVKAQLAKVSKDRTLTGATKTLSLSRFFCFFLGGCTMWKTWEESRAAHEAELQSIRKHLPQGLPKKTCRTILATWEHCVQVYGSVTSHSLGMAESYTQSPDDHESALSAGVKRTKEWREEDAFQQSLDATLARYARAEGGRAQNEDPPFPRARELHFVHGYSKNQVMHILTEEGWRMDDNGKVVQIGKRLREETDPLPEKAPVGARFKRIAGQEDLYIYLQNALRTPGGQKLSESKLVVNDTG